MTKALDAALEALRNDGDFIGVFWNERGPNLYYALSELLEDSQHANHKCSDLDCPVARARLELEKTRGQS